MRPSSYNTDPDAIPRLGVLKSLTPFLFEFKGRVLLALTFLIGAKIATVAMPWVLKLIVDSLDGNPGSGSGSGTAALIVVPVALLLGYGALRFFSVFLGEMRDAVFARVTERAMRRVGLKVFSHLHHLDLEFHLSRQTGGLSRDIERGTSGISFLMRFLVFNILPTLIEIAMVAAILMAQFSVGYALGILLAVGAYVGFSVVVTEWRSKYVREANERDSQSNTRAIDSLLNFETVKYFNNEAHEIREYDRHLSGWEQARINTRLSLSALNSGQAFIIAASVTAMLVMAAHGVADGSLTLGDFVMINAYTIQLFIPLNFLGFVYREIRQALINIEKMFELLKISPRVTDAPDAQPLEWTGQGNVEIEFRNVVFGYKEDRRILHGVSFVIEAGRKTAIVGASGAGKSTIARLLFRFYDADEGQILINGRDIRSFTQDSVRQVMGVVPQDTVLFNESIEYNIAYGQPIATTAAIHEAARRAHLNSFIDSLPQGWQTRVGERGLKVSGGEKQRIAIARVLLKNPPFLIFDEATSSLDVHSEQSISLALDEMAQSHTTLVIAHRLSTVMNADRIIVLDRGQVVEQGSHARLLQAGGSYARLWQAQQSAQGANPEGLVS